MSADNFGCRHWQEVRQELRTQLILRQMGRRGLPATVKNRSSAQHVNQAEVAKAHLRWSLGNNLDIAQ